MTNWSDLIGKYVSVKFIVLNQVRSNMLVSRFDRGWIYFDGNQVPFHATDVELIQIHQTLNKSKFGHTWD
jgi:hypothetical protein